MGAHHDFSPDGELKLSSLRYSPNKTTNKNAQLPIGGKISLASSWQFEFDSQNHSLIMELIAAQSSPVL